MMGVIKEKQETLIKYTMMLILAAISANILKKILILL